MKTALEKVMNTFRLRERHRPMPYGVCSCPSILILLPIVGHKTSRQAVFSQKRYVGVNEKLINICGSTCISSLCAYCTLIMHCMESGTSPVQWGCSQHREHRDSMIANLHESQLCPPDKSVILQPTFDCGLKSSCHRH